MASKKHPGFKAIARKIARKQHITVKEASREVAYSSRHASPAAKRRNPRLKKV